MSKKNMIAVVLTALLLGAPSLASAASPLNGPEKAGLTVLYGLQGVSGGVLVLSGVGIAVGGSEAAAPIPMGVAVSAFGACEIASSGLDIHTVLADGEIPAYPNCLSKLTAAGLSVAHASQSVTAIATSSASGIDAGLNILGGAGLLRSFNSLLGPLAGAVFSESEILWAGVATVAPNLTGAVISDFASGNSEK